MIEEVSQNFTVFPESVEIVLSSGLLRLRPPRLQDGEAISKVLSDERVSRYLAALPCPLDDRSLRDYLDFLTGPDQVSKVLEFDGKFAGLVSLSTQLTFWVAHKYWRMGLASSAVRWVVEHHLGSCASRPLIAEVHSANQSSISLLEKLGFEKTGQMKRRFSFISETTEDFVIYELKNTSA
ncbi:GNAT family N-acetyltransferase [uncultured Roseibium sp.]|uniref:GNAT family N-acetyltransferase n=1 Tax=uncultured Roseibium sp. TaxID=1936171 RepID=UPI002615D842|nr:GNAT family N-acetyltransferase [uncultured Roseibium sp.]